METLQENGTSHNSPVINEEIREYLLGPARWAQFLAILGFIGVGFMVLASISFATIGGNLAIFSAFGYTKGVVSLLYLVIAAATFFPYYFLFKSSEDLKNGLLYGNHEILTGGFKNLRSYFKFLGIMTIVLFALSIFMVLGVIIFAVVFKTVL